MKSMLSGAVLGLRLAGIALAAGASAMAQAPGMPLGAQTHFSQNWPLALLDLADEIKIASLRDGLAWGSMEREKGRYAFDGARSAYLDDACEGRTLLLTIEPRNALYDDGGIVASNEGRKAYAAYLVAVADRLKGCLIAVEVGNEINGEAGMRGVAMKDRPEVYAALLKEAYEAMKRAHPDVAILGGSTNVVGVGFLESVFAAGALAHMDGVAVHPYRREAESLDVELERLKAAMRRHGPERPIWATEFSDDFPTPEAAAPHLVKMLAIMSAAGVERAYWYALIDQKWFPTMGLFTTGGVRKPAGDAALMTARRLTPMGRARRLDLGDDTIFAYRFGDGPIVVWGAPKPLKVEGAAPKAFSATGAPIPVPAAIGETPVVLEGADGISVAPGPVLGDSLLQYPAGPWRYATVDGAGRAVDLRFVDWEWTSYLGAPGTKPLRVNVASLAVSGDGERPNHVRLRFVAPVDADATLVGCFRKADKGDGLDVSVVRNGETLSEDVVTTTLRMEQALPSLRAGEAVDVLVGPNETAGGDVTNYRLRVVRADAAVEPFACD